MSAYDTAMGAVRAQTPPLKTRKPTGEPSWPLVLIEGGEKSGKTWACAAFTASDKIGQAYVLDWGEGTADEYAAIPGADYLVVDHDGSWEDIARQLRAVAAEAHRAAEAGEPPVVLIVDGMSAEWDHLKAWADAKAVDTPSAKRKLAQDPGAEISIPMNLWNEVHTKHYRDVMRVLMRFPGIAVITARGKEVAALDDQGRPIPGERSYRVEGHKNLAYDASAWIRLSRDAAPMVVGARSVHAGVRPGVQKPRQVPDFTIEWLVFDVLLKGKSYGAPRPLVTEAAPTDTPSPVQDAVHVDGAPNPVPIDWMAALEEAGDNVQQITDLWNAAKYAGAGPEVREAIEAAGRAAAGADGGDQ